MTVIHDNELNKNRQAITGDGHDIVNDLEILKINTNDDDGRTQSQVHTLNMNTNDFDEPAPNESPDTSIEMPSFNPCRANRKCSLLFVISCLSLVVGLIMLFILKPVVDKILAHKLVIVAGREGHKFWEDPPASIHRKMYVWHCTNPIEVQNGGIPELIERGPYVYREEWNRSNIIYSDDLDTLSYIPITTLYFDRSQSVGPDDEYVSVINVPFMAMAHEVQFYSPAMQEALSVLLYGLDTHLFVNVTVKQLMEGYTDPLIDAASRLKPGTLRDGKFGILQARNGSYYQNFTIHTGLNDVTRVAKVVSFNGLQTLNYWSTPQANMLNGTDGSLFPPGINKNQQVYSYNADMCRSYYLSFLRERKDGYVTLYDFHLSSNVYNMSREENRGFCGHGPCLGDGVLNISTCYSGVWGFISSPHFFQADAKFRDNVHGMQPDPSKHEFIMSFEPLTSVPFAVNVRLQLSFYMPQIPKIDLLKSVKPIIIPIVWFDDEARITPDVHSQLSTLVVFLNVAYYMKFIIPAISALVVLLTSLYIFRNWRYVRRERVNSKVPLLNGSSEA